MKIHNLFLNLAVALGMSLGPWMASAAQLTIPLQDRASGVQWGPGYSVPNNEQHLEVGAAPQAFGVGNGNTSAQLRFDATPLNGLFTSINSVTLRLTQFFSHGDRQPAVVEAHRLLATNSDWNNNGNYGTKDGVNAWAGGASGALVEGTDYEATILGSVTVTPSNPVGTTYDLVISGQAAATLINAWLSGSNEGLLLRANPPAADADNRVGFDLAEGRAPQLIVDYTPFVPPVNVSFEVQQRASGVQWAPGYSVPNNEQHLEVGATPQAFGVGNGNTSTQLRFDVTPLQGVFTSINSVTLRLTQFFSHDNRQPAVVEAHRLLPANADWNNNGNYGTRDGANAWAGGASGALVEGTDYEATILGSVTVNPPNPVGTTYDLVISGEAAASLINAWLAGPNEGLLLRANPPAADADNRVGFDLAAGRAPQLIVNYAPLGGPAITEQPADTTGPEGGSATFTVAATGAPPLGYQWTQDGEAIANATNASYTISQLGTNDNGAQFRCVVTDGASLSVTSSAATLTVIPDSTPPILLGAVGVNFTTVEVTFSEPVGAATATDAGNFTISDGINVVSAVLGVNPATVTLTTTPQVVGNTYTLSVSGVRDASSGANLVAPGSTATFTTPASKLTLEVQQRASGAEWAPGFSEPNGEQFLVAGAVPSAFGVGKGRQSTQLRFDVTVLNGGYAFIQSMTIRLTQKLRTPGREAGMLEAYRLMPDNADWNNNGTFGTKDGSNPWAGGANGALVPDVDYDNFLLGNVGYNPENAVDTIYDLVIPGSIATDLIAAWASGTGNEGFLIRGVVPEGYAGDNRVLFYHEGANGPKLIVEFSPLTLAITQQPPDVTVTNAARRRSRWA